MGEKAEKIWEFKALDTLFFRGGTPYNAGEGGQSGVKSYFPPFMTTLQGAVRTALAVTQGWSSKEPDNKWPKAELGDAENLGQLYLKGPYLLWGKELLLPAPLLLLRGKKTNSQNEFDFTRLVPAEEVVCDLGRVRLPALQGKLSGAKQLAGCWLNSTGMSEALNGELPVENQIYEQGKLWQIERRVGLERNAGTRTAKDSMLYSCEHIRPNNKLTIAVVVSGVPEEWHKEVNPVIYLGGEGRVVSLTVKDENLPLPNYPVLKLKNGLLCYTVTLITPAYYEDVEKLKEVLIRGMLAFPGQCVSACLGKLEQVGGWDIENCCPRPLHPLIPAGSTWFFEAKETELQEISKLHGQFIGDRNNYGFGQILIGRWEENK